MAQHTQPLVSCQRLAVVVLDEAGINIDLTKIVDQHAEPQVTALLQQMVDQGCFTGAQITANYRDRNRHT